MLFIIILFSHILLAYSYEDNTTNVGVYANHLSSCNLNHDTGNLLCINQVYGSVIQYHDVIDVTMCPYHYCVQFDTDEFKLVCTGYVYLKIGGDNINPLTPNGTYNTHFTGDPDNEIIDIGVILDGFNILIDHFEQNVETTLAKPFEDVICKDPISTCVQFEDGDELCFGGDKMTFHGFVESLILGLVIPGAMSFVIYLLFMNLHLSCASNACVIIIIIPFMLEFCCMLIVFLDSDFIVQIPIFVIASMVGIAAGRVLAVTAVSCVSFVTTNRIRTAIGDGDENKGMLKRSGQVVDSGSMFVIGDDDDYEDHENYNLTEIELGDTNAVSDTDGDGV
jgi:hypothetical protein